MSVHLLADMPNANTNKTLKKISTALNDIKGNLSSINVMNNAKQSGGYRLRKTQRKFQKILLRTHKH